MRVNDDYEAWNVSAQVEDESSVWSFWKQALQVRKQYDILVGHLQALCFVLLLTIHDADLWGLHHSIA
jgi:hypothetical protein